MKPRTHLLEFEKPLIGLAEEINKLEILNDPAYANMVADMKQKLKQLHAHIFANLEPHQIVQVARHPDRPYVRDLLDLLTKNFIELHGDRLNGDDPAIVGGIAELEDGLPIMIIGMDKGRGIREKQRCNFGMPQPSGYRKALRLFKHAERFKMPIVCLIDTPGAYPGLEAESHGQASAIANNILALLNIKTPILAIITGEGGSGGALALAVANRVAMLELAIYSVISPEGCAAILWRTRSKSPEAGKALCITSTELRRLGLIDSVINEPPGGAHTDPESTARNIKKYIIDALKELLAESPHALREARLQKFRAFGSFCE